MPRSREPTRPPSSEIDVASRNAPPSPWTQRKTMRAGRDHEAAQPIDAAVNSASPTCAQRRGSRWRERAAIAAAATATTRLYEVITHETPTIEVLNAPYRSGSARTTIDESANATATDAATAIVSSRRRSGRRTLHQPPTRRTEAELPVQLVRVARMQEPPPRGVRPVVDHLADE